MQTSNLADLPDNHQHRTIATALSFVGDFSQALDCGAHRGTVTAQLLRRFSFVVAIEPSELAQRIPKGARVIQAAVGDKPGHCSMKHGTENTGQRHVVEGEDTPVITIDSLNLSPTFIKLDVEGMEWHVIKGAEQTIKRCKPVIMLEENGLNRRYGVPDGEAGRLLESWGAVRVAVCNKDWIYKW